MTRIVLISILLLSVPVKADDTAPLSMPEPREGDILVNIGADDETEGDLGFGWSRREHLRGQTFRWMDHLEGDVRFELDRVSDVEVWVTAAPLYLNWRTQRMGIYLNRRFVAEEVMPQDHAFGVYRFQVPARYLQEGRNQLTLRAGYRHRIGRERRKLSLAVQTILIRPMPGAF